MSEDFAYKMSVKDIAVIRRLLRTYKPERKFIAEMTADDRKKLNALIERLVRTNAGGPVDIATKPEHALLNILREAVENSSEFLAVQTDKDIEDLRRKYDVEVARRSHPEVGLTLTDDEVEQGAQFHGEDPGAVLQRRDDLVRGFSAGVLDDFCKKKKRRVPQLVPVDHMQPSTGTYADRDAINYAPEKPALITSALTLLETK
jgi:hypothetical protein